METQELISGISALVTVIRTPLLESGLKPSAIAFKKAKLEALLEKPAELAKIHDWLVAFNNVYVADYYKVLKLVPEGVWQMYANLGQRKGIYELDERNRVIKIMHEQWAKRPDALQRKPKPNVKKQQQVRS